MSITTNHLEATRAKQAAQMTETDLQKTNEDSKVKSNRPIPFWRRDAICRNAFRTDIFERDVGAGVGRKHLQIWRAKTPNLWHADPIFDVELAFLANYFRQRIVDLDFWMSFLLFTELFVTRSKIIWFYRIRINWQILFVFKIVHCKCSTRFNNQA